MSESEPTQQPSVDETEVTGDAEGVEVTEVGDCATESDTQTQEPADAEPAAENETESEVESTGDRETESAPESEGESGAESEAEPAAQTEEEGTAETETAAEAQTETAAETAAAPEAEARDGVDGEQATQVVPGEQATQVVPGAEAAAASPSRDLGFAPLGDPAPPPATAPSGAPTPGYPAPQAAGHPPQAPGYPAPQAAGYQPQAAGYPAPQAGGYPPQAGGYPPQPGGYPAPQPGYPAPYPGGYPPQAYAQPPNPAAGAQFRPPAQPSYGAYPVYAYGPMAVGTPGEPAVDPAVKKRKRKRVLWTVAAVVVVGGLIGGGVYALLPGRTGNSVVAAVECRPADLAGCLIKAPAGAVPLTSEVSTDNWPKQTTVSANDFASHIVVDSPGVGADAATEVASDNVEKIVHNDWNAVDGSNVDLVLLSFDTQADAQSWNSARSGEILSGYPGQTVKIPGDSTGAAHVAVKEDAHGNLDAAYSAAVGDLVLNVDFSSPSPFNAQDLANWAGTELASLHGAPAAPADPAPTPVGTEQVACQSRLTACLTPLPDGGQPWTSSTGSDWVAGSTLSTSQLVDVLWSGSTSQDRSEVMSNMTSNGVTGVAHEDWTVGEEADQQADIYLVQTISATGAKNLAQNNFGEPDWNNGLTGTSYSVPGLGNIQAWYTNKTDSNGFIEYSFTATIGNVVACGWMYFYGSFVSSLANSWTKDEVDSMTATERTAPLGMFPLNASGVPASSQGTCAASGDCLLPLPGGASDTTASSYEETKSLPAAQYAIQYETGQSDEVTTWLTSDGFQSAEHRSWTASYGATADVALIEYAKPAQAQAAVLLEYGINAAGDRSCTDSAAPDSRCLAEPVSADDPLLKDTVWVLAWKGDYEVSLQVTATDAADVSQAYTWAQQQLDMLPAN